MNKYLLALSLSVGCSFGAMGQEFQPPPPLKPQPLPDQFPSLTKPNDLPTMPTPSAVPMPPTGPAVTVPGHDLVPTTPAPKPAEKIVTPTVQAPLVTAEIITPETANLGQPLTQEIVVRNLGKSAVYHVRVEQEVPAGVRYLSSEPRADATNEKLSWAVGMLEAASEKRIKVNFQPSAEGDLNTRATVTFATNCAATTRLTRPKLVVAIIGPSSALVGEPAAFQIKLSNAGTGPINKLLLRDKLPMGLQHPSGNTLEAEVAGLAPGESRTVTLKTTSAKVGKYVHEITAFADGATATIQPAGGIRNSDLEATAKTEINIVEPGLDIKLSGPKTCLVRCEGVLSIDLTNPGSATTKNIVVQTRVPEGMDFVALSDEGRFDPATRVATWAFASLDPATNRVLTLKVRGTTLGDANCMAIARAEGGLSAKKDMIVHVEGVPALGLEIVNVDDPAQVGADATYEVRIVNRGTCPCTGIQIVAIMPEGMELREASAPAPYKVQGQQVQFAAFAKLATKADLVYKMKCRSKVPGDVRFRVQLTCDQLQQPVLKEESSRFYKP